VTRAQCNIPALLFLSLLATGAPMWALAGPGAHASVTVLGHDSRATIHDDGSVLFDGGSWIGGRSLLTLDSPWSSARGAHRLSELDQTFFLVTREGADGGHRGLSRHADDDGDGLVDEDPANGLDDDGDGNIDEDFAAIGDQMTVAHFGGGDHDAHIEGYHWNYVHLREAMVLAWSGRTLNGEDITLTLPVSNWRESKIGRNSGIRSGAKTASHPMFAAELPGDDAPWWIGVVVLESGDGTAGSPRLEGTDLVLAIDETLVIGVAVTRTLSQLRCRLAATLALKAGARAAPERPATPWIVPPPPRLDTGDLPVASLRAGPADRVVVDIEVSADWPLLLDPETLSLDDRSCGWLLGASWIPAAAEDSDSWRATALQRRSGLNALPDPFYADLPDQARRIPGRWTFEYASAALSSEPTKLSARSLCGLTLDLSLETPSPAAQIPEPPQEEERPKRRPSLAPHLLEPYPNPFVGQLNLRFTVPQTVGEGFVWEDDADVPLKAEDPIPYRDSPPRVMMKIYSVAGHEVATVFDEICGVGTRTTSWDGLDTHGRPVAAGTYFCKLQIENWSITQRVALLR